MMPIDFRQVMVDKLLNYGWGYTKPTLEEVAYMRAYYSAMSDNDIFEEYTRETYKAGQDSMSPYWGCI